MAAKLSIKAYIIILYNKTLIYFPFHTYEYNPRNKQERNK